MNKYKKTALLTFLLFVPILLLGHFYGYGIAHTGGPLIILFVPAIITSAVLENAGSPEWLIMPIALAIEYLACFIAMIGIRALFSYFRKINNEQIG